MKNILNRMKTVDTQENMVPSSRYKGNGGGLNYSYPGWNVRIEELHLQRYIRRW